MDTKKDLENILVTQIKEETLVHSTDEEDKSTITYKRLNHIPFNYQISIDNPQGSRKKVIVRLFLGLATDLTDTR